MVVADRKKITVCVPCFNEEGNIDNAYARITKVMQGLPEYDYEIIFADNNSTDRSRELIRDICERDRAHAKAIFNEQNMGPGRSGNNLVFSSSGDAVAIIPCDLQEPPELIPQFIEWWEKGYKLVMGQKQDSELSKVNKGSRGLYYKIIDIFSDYPEYPQVTGFGLMDISVVRTFQRMGEPVTEWRHLFAECGYDVKLIPYKQAARTAGKSSYNLWRFLDHGILSLCTTSRKPLRWMTLLGLAAAVLAFIVGIVYLVLKIINWNNMDMGTAPILIGVFFIGAVQLFCIGMLGEYIGIVSERVKSKERPLVIERERINFD